MELNIKGNIEINGINLKINKLVIEDEQVKAYTNYSETNIKNIKLLKQGDLTIIKNGKFSIKCNKDCKNCPLCKITMFDIYTRPNSFKIGKGYRCGKKGTYSETLEELPSSKIKSKHEIEIRKAYELIDELFIRRKSKYVTDMTIDLLIEEIDDALTPNMCEHYDEYGHERIELETIEIRKNKYGYTLWYHGRMGDYGLSSTVYLNRKCNVEEIASALRNRYYKTYRTNIKIEE